jgi:hypothetical protein
MSWLKKFLRRNPDQEARFEHLVRRLIFSKMRRPFWMLSEKQRH